MRRVRCLIRVRRLGRRGICVRMGRGLYRQVGRFGRTVGWGGLSGAAPIAGATADYNFSGSGTVVTDISGNGNDGTLGTGALAPTWTPQGLTFTGQNRLLCLLR